MRRWRRINEWAGLIVFGFPVAAGVAAAITTAARFGVTSIVVAALPLLVIASPGLLWIIYLRSSRRRSRPLKWCVALAVSLVVLATSPIGLWTWHCLGVLLSELARLVVVATSRGQRPPKRSAGGSTRSGANR